MNKSSRRHFLAASGAGVAAAGAATLLPAPLATAQQPQAESMINEADFEAGAGSSLSETVLACVSDASPDEVIVINGAAEITVTDPALAHRITQLSRKGA
jgi:hypothetical protein